MSVLYTHTHMHARIALRFAIRHTITLMLSITQGSPAVVMAAVGTAEREIFVVYFQRLRDVKCEAAVKVASERRNGSKTKKKET